MLTGKVSLWTVAEPGQTQGSGFSSPEFADELPLSLRTSLGSIESKYDGQESWMLPQFEQSFSLWKYIFPNKIKYNIKNKTNLLLC